MGSTFIRRLKYYGIGFGIGIILVTFLLPNRSCSWTPGNRVKNMILGRLITVNEVESELLRSKNLTDKDVISVLNDGDINFKISKKDGDFKVYVIEKEFDGKGKFKFYFTLPNESFISEVKIGETNAQNVKNSTVGYGRFLSTPNDEYLISPDSTAKVTCQLNELNITDVKKLYKTIRKEGRINFEKSNFSAKPKVEQYLEYVDGVDTIGFQSVWYQNKIFISNFISKNAEKCSQNVQK